ncbi:hypothetical protein EB061_10920 [bacterium]|nr:hypothetical protein [bacterium]
MGLQGDSLFVTVWKLETSSSRVYRIDLGRIRSHVERSEVALFLEEGKDLGFDLKGNTGLLRVLPGEFLYDNSTEEAAGESFLLSPVNGQVRTAAIPAGCRVLDGHRDEWLLYCGGTRLMTGNF